MLTLLIIIIIIIIIAFIYKSRNLEHFDPTNQQLYGYINIDSPYIKPVLLKNLLTDKECHKIIDYCVDSTLNQNTVHIAPVSKRYNQQFALSKNDPLVKQVVQKLADDLDIPFKNAEDVQIFRYLAYQFTKPKNDACCNNDDTCQEYLKTGGQRILTCIIYLNKEFTRGEIYFDKLNLKFKPGVGEGILFYNVAQNINKCHPKASFSNIELTRGEKWVLTVRFREAENTLVKKTI